MTPAVKFFTENDAAVGEIVSADRGFFLKIRELAKNLSCKFP
jgi:hypothetical protein